MTGANTMKPKKYANEYGGRIFETIQVTADNLYEAAPFRQMAS